MGKMFTDKAGRSWRVTLDADTVDAVRRETGVDLSREAAGGAVFNRFAEDPELFAQVMYVLCAPQVEARHLTPEQFAYALAGASARAAQAFIEASVAVFPDAMKLPANRAAKKLR